MKTHLLLLLIFLPSALALEPVNTLAGPFIITRISDGDTLELEGVGRVRLIGVDTPEKFEGDKLDRDSVRLGLSKADIQAMGERASLFTMNLLEDERVFLELDVSERDPFGRVLGYVYYLDADGVWEYEGARYSQVNFDLVQSGWAEAFTIAPNVAYAELYVEAARLARENTLGLWALTPQAASDAPVLIECILYNPDGVDKGYEQVTLYALEETDVTDWYIADDAGNVWLFEGVLEAEYLYDFTGYEDAIWNNGGDGARLYDADGRLMDEFAYAGGGVEACR